MPEIKFYDLQCPRCGGQLNKQGDIYVCACCEKSFEKQTVTDVADQLRSVLNEQKQEAVANLRQLLWQEMHAQYINSARVIELAREIKNCLPDDYFANFCEIANSANDKAVNAFLNNTSKEDMADYADIVLDFMLRSAKQANLSAISLFIERAFKGDPVNYDKYTTKLEEEAEKVNKGVYDLILTRDVFLAYSSADIDKVIDLCDYLESNKISCFLALRNLRHGRGAVDNYDKALKTAIDNCKTVVFVSSRNSRSRTCDALIKELPYIKQKDIENAPAEYKFAYDRLPAEYMMPRVEYLIEDYSGDVAETVTKEFFHGLEWCKSRQAVAGRITRYLTETRETAAQKAEREKREFQQKLEEERRKAKELELKIAENERLRAEAERARIEAENSRRAEDNKPTTKSTAGEITESSFIGKKVCKKCKKENRASAKFCSDCGSREFFVSYDEYLASKIKFCANCGTQNNVEDKFCAECGSKEFVPTKKAYEDLQARMAEEERQQKIREEEEKRRKEEAERKRIEEERKRKEEEERQRKIREEQERLRREEQERQRKIREEQARREEEERKIREEEERKRKEEQDRLRREEANKALSKIGEYKKIGGGYVTFGTYPQSKKAGNVQIGKIFDNERGYYLGNDNNLYAECKGDYYKVEPIKWKVLSIGSELFLVSDMILDAHRFDKDSNNYENSEIRSWLNGEFYNKAFSQSQKNKIVTTTVDNSLSSTGDKYNKYVCGDTNDKVFLLSHKEAERYFTIDLDLQNFTRDLDLRREGTDYAKARGLYVYDGNGKSWWWLRSPYYDESDRAQSVDNDGCFSSIFVNFVYNGALPALKIRVD